MNALVITKAEERSHRKVFEWNEDLAAARVDRLLAS